MELPPPTDETSALGHVLQLCDPRAGDDAAVLLVGGGSTCVSVDSTIEGRHVPAATTPFALGRRAVARAASDLAAMGAAPLAMTCAVHVPAARWADAVEAVAGAAERGREQGLVLVGGDLAATPAAALALVVTVLGRRGAARAAGYVGRSGARPGDVLVVTGTLGGAGIALARGDGQLPEPPDRIRAGRALARHATAMTDISDGLAADARQLATASAVLFEVDLDRIPVAEPDADRIAACTAGDDYELLACVPAARLEQARAGVQRADPTTGLTVVGVVADAPTGVTWLLDGRAIDVGPGFAHR